MPHYYGPRKPVVAYSGEQLAAILEKARQQPHDHLLIRVASAFELHASQVLSIRTADVRIERPEILLPAGPRRGLEPYPIPPDLFPELTRYLQTHAGKWLFTGRDGQMIRSEVRYRVAKYAKQAGLLQCYKPYGNQHCVNGRPPCHFTGVPHRPRPRDADADTGKGLSKEDVSRMLTTAKAQIGRNAERDHLMMAFMYRYALRPCEVAKLRVHHVDLRGQRILIQRGKSGPSRMVLLFDDLVKPLEHYLRARPLPKTAPPSDVLFPSHRKDGTGQAYGISGQAVNLVVKRIARLAGVSKPVSAYAYRHSMATHLGNAGWPLEDIQHHLGQNTPLATPVYVAMTPERQDAMQRKLRHSAQVAKY